jgi:hypothetical protein
MTVIQAMFNSLAQVLTNFETVVSDGANQGVTLENTRRLQEKSGLPVTGVIDRPTWSYLARLYHLFITRGTP